MNEDTHKKILENMVTALARTYDRERSLYYKDPETDEAGKRAPRKSDYLGTIKFTAGDGKAKTLHVSEEDFDRNLDLVDLVEWDD